jgi:hypothetical protein
VKIFLLAGRGSKTRSKKKKKKSKVEKINKKIDNTKTYFGSPIVSAGLTSQLNRRNELPVSCEIAGQGEWEKK